jgi:hypothetical protein
MAFYPLFPLAYRLVGALPGPMTLWGSLLSSALFALALCALYQLTVDTLGTPVARRAVLYLAVAPMAFVFAVPYSESLFLLLAVVAFLAQDRGHPWAAGSVGALAALARPVGIALVPALWWRAYRCRANWRAFVAPLLIVAAEASFFVYAWRHTGDLLAPIHAQQHGWRRSVSFLPVLVGHVIWADIAHGGHLSSLIDLAFLTAWCVLFAVGCRMRLPGEYLIFAALLILLPTSVGQLDSIGRFGTVAFPLFWALASVTTTRRRHIAVTTGSLALVSALTLATYAAGSIHP